jgi:Protein of unknown function (DUF4007)
VNSTIATPKPPAKNVSRGATAAVVVPKNQEPQFRFSGHQTFPLRITWIPKAVNEIVRGDDPLTQVDEGITKLGLGKNMVEALRCWVEAFQVARRVQGRWELTDIGGIIFHSDKGLDPYLEDVSTSWLLHWLISNNTVSPFFAWECVFNRWSTTEFSATQIVEAFEQEANKHKPASLVTLRQHWEILIHSYRPTRSDRGEDHLDSALSALRLIREIGERPNADGRWEILFGFDLSPKLAISEQLFTFFVHDWWNRKFPEEHTVPLREIILGFHSPGRLLKMPESEVVSRVNRMATSQPRIFRLVESTSLRQLHRLEKSDGVHDLKEAYKTPNFA